MSNAAQTALSSQRPVWLAALLAGLIAILFNSVMLEFGHVLGIDTGLDRRNKRHEARKPRSYLVTPVAPLLLPESLRFKPSLSRSTFSDQISDHLIEIWYP